MRQITRCHRRCKQACLMSRSCCDLDVMGFFFSKSPHWSGRLHHFVWTGPPQSAPAPPTPLPPPRAPPPPSHLWPPHLYLHLYLLLLRFILRFFLLLPLQCWSSQGGRGANIGAHARFIWHNRILVSIRCQEMTMGNFHKVTLSKFNVFRFLFGIKAICFHTEVRYMQSRKEKWQKEKILARR